MNSNKVIGQQAVLSRLKLLDEEQRVPHAILLAGQKGVGKMAIAMEFAKHLLLKTDPHGNAEAMIANHSHPDLIFSFPVIKPKGMPSDKKMRSTDFMKEWNEMISESVYFDDNEWMSRMNATTQQMIIGVGESEELIHKLSLKSSQGGYKVVVMWQPEKMNGECANKLLKLIEEPPTMTVMILVSNNPEQILGTILSRVQRIDVKPIPESELADALIERRSIEPDAARRIARSAGGSWLNAVEMISANSENAMFLELFIELMRLSYQKQVKELKGWSERLASLGRSSERRFLTYMLYMLRECFMYNFQEDALCYMTKEEEQFAKKFSPFVNELNIIEFSELCNLAIRDIGQNANGKIVFYDFALKTILLLNRRNG